VRHPLTRPFFIFIHFFPSIKYENVYEYAGITYSASAQNRFSYICNDLSLNSKILYIHNNDILYNYCAAERFPLVRLFLFANIIIAKSDISLIKQSISIFQFFLKSFIPNHFKIACVAYLHYLKF